MEATRLQKGSGLTRLAPPGFGQCHRPLIHEVGKKEWASLLVPRRISCTQECRPSTSPPSRLDAPKPCQNVPSRHPMQHRAPCLVRSPNRRHQLCWPNGPANTQFVPRAFQSASVRPRGPPGTLLQTQASRRSQYPRNPLAPSCGGGAPCQLQDEAITKQWLLVP